MSKLACDIDDITLMCDLVTKNDDPTEYLIQEPQHSRGFCYILKDCQI